jgi:hypothetical protein
MIVFSEWSDLLTPSSSADDIKTASEAAQLAGCRVSFIPHDFAFCENATNALWHLPVQAEETPAVWIGYIPSFERYRDIYHAALLKNIRLLNNPDEHRRAMEFDSAYALLGDLTPQSVIIENEMQSAEAAQKLGFPVFVKGAVQSRKARGWRACVANSLDELQELTRGLLTLDARSRGRVVVRQLVELRHHRKSAQDFPLGREYRVFVYDGKVIGLGYYWEGDDTLKALNSDERATVTELAEEAARRLNVPYIASRKTGIGSSLKPAMPNSRVSARFHHCNCGTISAKRLSISLSTRCEFLTFYRLNGVVKYSRIFRNSAVLLSM